MDPQSVTLLLEDDIDVSRGDLIVPSKDAPPTTQDVEATVCHVADQPSTVGHRVLLKHGTRTVKAIVKDIPSRLTLDDLSLHPHPGQLVANDIGRVKIRAAEPLPLDSYADSRDSGAFILIDPGGMAPRRPRAWSASRSPRRSRSRTRATTTGGTSEMHHPPTSTPRSPRRAAASAAAPSAAGRAEWRDVRNDVRALPARPVPPPDVPDATTKTCRPPGHDLRT